MQTPRVLLGKTWANRFLLIALSLGLVIALSTLAVYQRRFTPPKPPPELDLARIPYTHPELGINIENYPVVDGSTSTQPLQMLLACKLFGVASQWVHNEKDDQRELYSDEYEDIPKDVNRDSFVQRSLLCVHIRHLVRPHGTSEAYLYLIKKRVDLILVARSPSADELGLAGKLGVQFDARPVALDAFVFLLNGKNPVGNLTIEQIRDIYAGQILNWREVGGPDAPIRPYQRPRNSGSQELMQKLVMGGRKMIKAPDLLTGALMSATFLAIDEDVYGIGYSVYYYQEHMSPYRGRQGVRGRRHLADGRESSFSQVPLHRGSVCRDTPRSSARTPSLPPPRLDA